MTSFLCIDLETDSLNPEIANIKWIITYDGNNLNIIDYEKNGSSQLRRLIDNYDRIITFNGNAFDIKILKNHNILKEKDFFKEYFVKGIDIYDIFKKRATLIFPRGFESLSLAVINKKLYPDSQEQKLEFNYNLFKKKNSELTKDELELIYKYAKMDIILTWKLWQYLLDKFRSFAEFLNEKDVQRLKHITSSIATFGYKALCKEANIPEVWGENVDQDKFEGAFVLTPTKEFAKGNILYLDYSSLYPMIYIHNNLFSSNCKCCQQNSKWHGNEKWKLNGYYCSKTQGRIENIIKKFYLLRKECKSIGDDKQHAYKIILNSLYGSSSRQAFLQTYSPTIASDCTSLGQQIIKYSIKQLEDNKFGQVLMGDTDSIIIEVSKDKTKEECLEFVKQLSKEISNSFPFPWEEFHLKLEAKLKYIQFFNKDIDDNSKIIFKKKNYLYVTENNHLEIKGLDIIQKDATQLSKLIYHTYIKPYILKYLDCKMNKKDIDYWIKELLKTDISLLAKTFNIRNQYDSDTTLYNLIKEKYGDGELKLIKNKKIGAGKGVKYCLIEEAKQLSFNDLDLSDVYKELEPFIKEEQRRLI